MRMAKPLNFTKIAKFNQGAKYNSRIFMNNHDFP